MWRMTGVAILLASGAMAASVPRAPAPVREWNSNPVAQARVERTYGQLPVVFEPNRGQVDRRVKWLARCRGYTLFLTEREAVMALREGKGKPSSAVRMRLAGSRPWRVSEGLEATGGISNYFIGNDPKKWRTDIPHYRRVKYGGVYAGIDLVFYGNPQRLEYDLIVEPGADPRQIRLAYEGVKRIEVDSGGELVLTTHTRAELRQQRPRVYQEIAGQKVEVAGVYEILDRRQVGIQIAFYDASRPLVVDPQLVYSTYLGGTYEVDRGQAIAVDGTGSAYVTGYTQSVDFPAQAPYQADLRWPYDVFVTKLTPTGNALVYSTFLGGRSSDGGNGIAVDGLGSAYVTGETGSADFPTQVPYQSALRGQVDAFVTKLTPAGNALVYSTFLGGSNGDGGNGIAVDGAGSAYVTGSTASADFPTQAPYQAAPRGSGDVFVTKLTPAGDALAYSTFLGGIDSDTGNAIAVDGAGSAYVTGATGSADFPTQAPYQAVLKGRDAFVTKLTPTGDALEYSTFLGGSSDEKGNGIAVDGLGSAYVTGETGSVDFPTQVPYQTAFGGQTDTFVTRLTSGGNILVYSTYLGGSLQDAVYGIAVDRVGSVYLTGGTMSRDFPTESPYQTFRGWRDAFVTKFGPDASEPHLVATVSAASFAAGGPLAPASIASGFGQGLAATTEVATAIPLPTTLANVTVKVKDSAAVEREAPLFFVSAGQINYLIPEGTKTGPATVSVINGAQVVASGTLQIDGVAPGFFAANADGRGAPAAVAVRYAADSSVSWDYVFQCGPTSGSCVPKPIDLGSAADTVYLQLYGTGIRGVSSLSAATAKIGGVAAPVEYAGPAPGFVGLDQINIRLPRSLSGRGDVDVELTVDGKRANPVKVNMQ